MLNILRARVDLFVSVHLLLLLQTGNTKKRHNEGPAVTLRAMNATH